MSFFTMESFATPSIGIPIVVGISLVGYFATLVIYRLFLSPVSKFPGPLLPAITRYYELYYDVILQGQYMYRIEEMHKQYGPIVRVAPDEIHIRDSRYFDQLYVKYTRGHKQEWAAGRFGNKTTMITTPEHEKHRLRRGALNPMFAQRAINDFYPVIREKSERLSTNIGKYYGTDQPVTLSNAFSAFTGDIINEYAFGFSYDHLDIPDFTETFHPAFVGSATFSQLAVHFPWLFPVMNAIPLSVVEKMQPPLASLLRLKQDMNNLLTKIIRGEELPQAKSTQKTIFHEILNSDLPPEEKVFSRMSDEAQTIIGAGVETTSWALSVGACHIIQTPSMYQKLHDELMKAIPNAAEIPRQNELEKLPYLRACINESIRLSYGLTVRNPRLFDYDIQYGKWTIKAGTPVSMSVYDVHHDEEVFPNSHSFVPERWLNNVKAPDGSPLERYLVSFGKGTRACAGMSLAYTELFLVMATIYRRYRFELYETDVSDVAIKHDLVMPFPRLDSKGVRVKVVEVFK